ncbi:MAG: ABC transporter substrate-binding protein [Anaerolineae bacterium]
MTRKTALLVLILLLVLVACTPATTPTAVPTATSPPPPTATPLPPAPYEAPWYVEGVTVETYAGTGEPGFADGPANEAQFNAPVGLAADAAGNLYVFDWFNFRIRFISPDGMVTTLAGTGQPGFADGPAAQAQFQGLGFLAVDAAGNLYLGDGGNHRVRLITADGMVSTLAGTGEAGYRDGPADQAQFNNPAGVALDAAGNVYVGDTDNNRIRVITPEGEVRTLAGTGEPGYQDGPATEAQLNAPNALTVDAAGNVIVSEGIPWQLRGTNRLRLITPDGTVTTLAGSGEPGHKDGPAHEARFVDPRGPTFDGAGNLLVADGAAVGVRLITPDGLVYTLAGTGEWGRADGPGPVAQFVEPVGVAIGPEGEVYVADPGAHVIRRITYGHPDAVTPMPTATPPTKKHVIKIGYAHIEGAGFVPLVNAARMAVDEANTAGGVTIGGQQFTLEMVVAHECCGAEGAVFAATSLIEQGVVAVVGHTFSELAMAASPVYGRVGLVHIAPFASDPDYTFAGQPTAYRVAANAAFGIPVGARMVYEELGIRRAALLVEPLDYAQTVADEWQKAFEALGGETFRHKVAFDSLPETLTAIWHERAEAVIIFRPQIIADEVLVQQIREAGLTLPIIGYELEWLAGPLGAAAEGVYDIVPGQPEAAMPGFADFAAKYAANFTLGLPVPQPYDAMNVVIAAIRLAAETGAVTRESVAAAMETFRDEPYQGVIGTIQFDEAGDLLDQPFHFRKVVRGEWVDVER